MERAHGHGRAMAVAAAAARGAHAAQPHANTGVGEQQHQTQLPAYVRRSAMRHGAARHGWSVRRLPRRVGASQGPPTTRRCARRPDPQITSRTSASTREPCFRSWRGPSCRGAQCPARAGRRGSGLAVSRRGGRGGHTCQHRADREQDWVSARRRRTLRDGQCRAPLVPEDIQADAAVRVDVRVVDLGLERDLGRLERVVRGEGDRQEKDTARVRRVALW